MSRSEYSDDCDGFALIRWRGQVAAAIRGTRGQELLHGLASALDAMPEKRLIAEELMNSAGAVCALGALGHAMGRADAMQKVDPEDYEQVAAFFGVAHQLVREIMWVNDDFRRESESDRWRRVRQWVEEHIIRESQP